MLTEPTVAVIHRSGFFDLGRAGWFPAAILLRTSAASFANLNSRRRAMFWRTALARSATS